MKRRQLEAWQGEFGTAYTDRNVVDWRPRLPGYREMLGGLPIKRALEVGCNRGHNLIALAELLGDDAEVVGVEPNQHAREIARASSPKIGVFSGELLDLPFKDGYFDVVSTGGVLSHTALDNLPQAIGELYRVTRRYILAIEYFADEETVIPYRGHNDLLWKRDVLKHFQTQFPDLASIRSGSWGADGPFADSHWWVLEKSGQGSGAAKR